jgi:hypothetical protein
VLRDLERLAEQDPDVRAILYSALAMSTSTGT